MTTAFVLSGGANLGAAQAGTLAALGEAGSRPTPGVGRRPGSATRARCRTRPIQTRTPSKTTASEARGTCPHRRRQGRRAYERYSRLAFPDVRPPGRNGTSGWGVRR